MVSESSRLRASLKKENVHVKRLVVNQVRPPSALECKFCAMKRKVKSITYISLPDYVFARSVITLTIIYG